MTSRSSEGHLPVIVAVALLSLALGAALGFRIARFEVVRASAPTA